MIKNYFGTMIRGLLKRKLYTLINLSGLATGMAVCLLLVLYIQNELGYDQFQERGDQIFRIALERRYPGRSAHLAHIPQSIGQAIKKEFPEVEETTRIMDFGAFGSSIEAGGRTFEEHNIFSVDANFFRVFTGSFLQGDIHTALQSPGSTVISERTALKYFGSVEKAMDQEIVVNGRHHITVEGVCRDWPEKSHFTFDLLLSNRGDTSLDLPNYYDLSTYTYLLLNKQASARRLEAKLPLIIDKYVAGTIEKGFGESFQNFKAEGNGYRYYLQPIKKIHLSSNLEDEFRPNGNQQAVYLFAVIAVIILVLACINFINLSTAISMERAKEVGIRKTLGSDRKNLIFQFLSESILFSLASMALAFALMILLIPVLNKISGNTLAFTYYCRAGNLALLISFAVLVGVLAGLYPAWTLSSFRPVAVLKGNLRSGRKGLALRNTLVVFQFSVSLILIVAAMLVNQQMQYVLGNELGFKKDRIIQIDGLYHLPGDNGTVFVDGLSQIAGVQQVSKCSGLPDGKGLASCAFQVMASRLSRTQKTMMVDDQYMPLLGLELTQGRFFSRKLGSDSLSVVINEQAVLDFGLKNPVGSRLTSTEVFLNPQDGSAKHLFTVIGVVKNFHFQSLHEKIAPLVLLNSNKFGFGLAAVRIKGAEFKNSIAAMETFWKSFAPKHDFKYSFLDQNLADQYQAEQTAQKIVNVFSLLAIFIACIGLFGLATHSTLRRIKEVSIRKVLGAGIQNLLFILSRDFLKLILISCFIAFPLAWWALSNWLQNFAYRIDISWRVLLTAGALAFFIAGLTIGFHTLKAALANPVKNLRAE